MSWYKIFWWITIAERLQSFIYSLAIASTVFMIFIVIGSLVARISLAESNYDSDIQKNKKWLILFKGMSKLCIPLFCIFWILYITTPSKNDTILIIAGGAVGNFVTSDSSSKALPSEVTYFLREKIRAMTAEAKESMGIIDEKTKKINDLKELTKEEIIEKLKKDTSLLR